MVDATVVSTQVGEPEITVFKVESKDGTTVLDGKPTPSKLRQADGSVEISASMSLAPGSLYTTTFESIEYRPLS